MSEKAFEEKINRLSMMEQNAQYLGSQRQNFQNQLIEVESALEELETSSDSFKIIGNVMVQVSKEKLKIELESKKEAADIRIKSIEKQEEVHKKKTLELRNEVMKGMDTKKDD